MEAAQLLILGNGFDLHCGLKSSYKDFFYNTILDTTTINFNINQIKAGVNGFWEELLFEYYKQYGEKNFNWCDIESIIKETLLNIFLIDKGMTICLWKDALENAKSNHYPDGNPKRFQDPIIRHLYTYCFYFFVINKHKHCSDNMHLQLLMRMLLSELNNFERRFCKYIKDNIINPNNEKEFNKNYILNAFNLLAKLTGYSNGEYKSIKDIIEGYEEGFYEQATPTIELSTGRIKNTLSKEILQLKDTHILSFNYTALFDILKVKSPCEYNNVHGKLCMKQCEQQCESSNIIFGIDDSFIQTKDEISELYLFSKTYRKMFDTNTSTSILPPNNKPVTIKFYGHSLSEADYSYFQSIFDYYNLYGNSNVSLIFYYSEGYEQTETIYHLINFYGKTLSNKEQGKNMIHKLLLENRLKIKKLS